MSKVSYRQININQDTDHGADQPFLAGWWIIPSCLLSLVLIAVAVRSLI